MQTSLHTLHQKLIGLGIMPSTWQTIVECAVVVHRKKGQPLTYYHGDFFFITEGLLKQEYTGPSATDIERFLPAGSPCFATWSEEHQPDFIALEDAVLLRITGQSLQQIRHDHPSFVVPLGSLYEEWSDMLKVRMQLLAIPKKERGPAFRKRFGALTGYIPLKDLAVYLSVSPSYLGKHR
ncbi:Crp/Fnr family transcriptional regulator [Parapedobacter sp. 2B3]|uniref:Crp/Fnr family transcriptional regulator n=1 Tax=Parapedobacter sp. 2B3 TaxID=3342381 RepID=UPI0035B67EE5